MLKEIAGTRAYNVLKKKKIETVEDVCRLFPSKYYDFTSISRLDEDHLNKNYAFLGRLVGYDASDRSGRLIVRCMLEDMNTRERLRISWFGRFGIYRKLEEEYELDCLCIVGGKAKMLEGYPDFYMTEPVFFKKYNGKQDLLIYTGYPNFKGISEKKMNEIRKECLKQYEATGKAPEEIIKKYALMDEKEAIVEMHHPHSRERLKKAKLRIIFDDLFHFALKIEEKETRLPFVSSFKINTLRNTIKILQSLPFSLTKDQETAYEDMTARIKSGKRLNALVQGDVGCGKTILAFLLMFAMADNGYQSALLAPTQVLASQHYEELKEMAESYGIKVVFLSSSLKKKEKDAVLQSLKEGSALMAVGTHSILSKEVEFYNLGLSIIDEEHRFGVLQRESILEKAKGGMHTITMSATPIPRSLSEIIFSDNTQVYNIYSMPSGRKKIKTAIYSAQKEIFSFIRKELAMGHQAYVVCPLIEDSENMEYLRSVEQTYKEYAGVFGQDNVSILNGKMKEKDIESVIESFKAGETKILVSTTVVEVGVNIPNATVIVINNAERFGLASLHQLRGRVGRGNSQGYCILNSVEKQNARLAALCQYSDGFHIAEADLSLRGTGDIIGTEQSGDNYYVSLAMRYPELFGVVSKEVAARKK